MSDDPNADLLGYQWEEHLTVPRTVTHVWRVTGTAPWSDGQYVTVENVNDGRRTTRPAASVRVHKNKRGA